MINKYEWDLEDILENKTYDSLLKEWINCQNIILKQYISFLDSLDNFKKWIKTNEQYQILSSKISNYVSNNLNCDVVNPKWLSTMQQIQFIGQEFANKLSDITNVLIKNENKIMSYLQYKELQAYKLYFANIFRYKKHILSEPEEKILTELSSTHNGFESIFSILSNGDIKFQDAINSKSKKIPIKTISDVMIFLKHKDRKIRETAWLSFNSAFYTFKNTLTQTLYYNYLMLNTISKIKKYKDYVSSTFFADQIDEQLVLTLYKNVEMLKPKWKIYKDTREKFLKQQLKLSSLEPWDKTIELTTKDIKYSVEDAKKIALIALKPLGEEYISIVKKAFNEKWISWLSKPNKTSGAYSIGNAKGINKHYILMNYAYDLDSISTLVHELGHSVNSWYVAKNQKIYDNVSIFYAEISSIVNEILLAYHMLEVHRTNKQMKKVIYDNLIHTFFATTTSQIIFSDFEYNANRWINENKPFTSDSLFKLYLDMIEKYQGVDKEWKNKVKTQPYIFSLSTIVRISHFYVGNFYVYKYAIGQIIATIVATEIFNKNKNMISKYFKFLSSGNSLTPYETIKLLGLDIKSGDTFSKAFSYVANWIEEFKKL